MSPSSKGTCQTAFVRAKNISVSQSLGKLLSVSWDTRVMGHTQEAGPHQHGQVRLRRASDHVGDEALVSWGIQDGKVLFFCLKVGAAHLHRLPLVPLLLVCVQSPGEVPVHGDQGDVEETARERGRVASTQNTGILCFQ